MALPDFGYYKIVKKIYLLVNNKIIDLLFCLCVVFYSSIKSFFDQYNFRYRYILN